eukprot:3852759-Prymnesium_polylepis.1
MSAVQPALIAHPPRSVRVIRTEDSLRAARIVIRLRCALVALWTALAATGAVATILLNSICAPSLPSAEDEAVAVPPRLFGDPPNGTCDTRLLHAKRPPPPLFLHTCTKGRHNKTSAVRLALPRGGVAYITVATVVGGWIGPLQMLEWFWWHHAIGADRIIVHA